MPLITWSDKYAVNVKEFDLQHQKLISLINDLHDAMKAGKGKEVTELILDELISYTDYHFKAEEKLMKQHAYPAFDAHIGEHKGFVAKVTDFKESYSKGKATLNLDIATFLRDWLVNHINGTDKKYSDFFKTKGVK